MVILVQGLARGLSSIFFRYFVGTLTQTGVLSINYLSLAPALRETFNKIYYKKLQNFVFILIIGAIVNVLTAIFTPLLTWFGNLIFTQSSYKSLIYFHILVV